MWEPAIYTGTAGTGNSFYSTHSKNNKIYYRGKEILRFYLLLMCKYAAAIKRFSAGFLPPAKCFRCFLCHKVTKALRCFLAARMMNLLCFTVTLRFRLGGPKMLGFPEYRDAHSCGKEKAISHPVCV